MLETGRTQRVPHIPAGGRDLREPGDEGLFLLVFLFQFALFSLFSVCVHSVCVCVCVYSITVCVCLLSVSFTRRRRRRRGRVRYRGAEGLHDAPGAQPHADAGAELGERGRGFVDVDREVGIRGRVR